MILFFVVLFFSIRNLNFASIGKSRIAVQALESDPRVLQRRRGRMGVRRTEHADRVYRAVCGIAGCVPTTKQCALVATGFLENINCCSRL